ncbi:MAG: hypothetical protein FJX57_22995 [Alphaproteobacteria bacterium]|nr:hypothetical protein [Alphaproteobacteria bacterium]
MILEALASLTALAAPGARRAGLVHGQAAFIGRYLRHRHAWRPHLEACRRVILDAAQRSERRDFVVVLGSGPLFDVPLAALARGFRRVALIDAVHPVHARLQAAGLGNVSIIAASLVETSGSPPRYRSWRSFLPSPDLVIASMVLSQLPLLAVPSAPAGDDWRAAIIAQALSEITSGPGAACLVTETRRYHRASDGSVVAADPLFGIAPPRAHETWRWPMAPAGEAGPETVELDVAACLLRG